MSATEAQEEITMIVRADHPIAIVRGSKIEPSKIRRIMARRAAYLSEKYDPSYPTTAKSFLLEELASIAILVDLPDAWQAARP